MLPSCVSVSHKHVFPSFLLAWWGRSMYWACRQMAELTFFNSHLQRPWAVLIASMGTKFIDRAGKLVWLCLFWFSYKMQLLLRRKTSWRTWGLQTGSRYCFLLCFWRVEMAHCGAVQPSSVQFWLHLNLSVNIFIALKFSICWQSWVLQLPPIFNSITFPFQGL